MPIDFDIDSGLATNMTEIFYAGFPKEFSTKRKVVYNLDELMHEINLMNGVDSAITTIYRYPLWTEKNINYYKPVKESAIISAVYIDIDLYENSYEVMVKTYSWAMEMDIRRFVLFSGRGYHVFLFIVPPMENPKETLYSFCNYLEQLLDVEFDKTAFGNLTKLSRVPNTYNLKRDAFCIPLTEEQIFNMNFKEHKEMAQNQQFLDPTIGSKRLDISEFSKKEIYAKYKYKNIPEGNLETKISVKEAVESGLLTLDIISPCISEMLKNPKLNYTGRSSIVKYFAEFDYDGNMIKEILRNSLSPEKYRHAIDSHLETMLNNGFKTPLTCKLLRFEGLCPECPRNNPYEIGVDIE